MAKYDVLQSHVEALLAEVLDVERVQVGDRREVPVEWEDVQIAVRLRVDGGHHHAEVFGFAVHQVGLDPGLLEELNTLNRRACRARVFWAYDSVVVAGEVDAERTSAQDLSELCGEVAGWVRNQGPRLAAKYGGFCPHDGEEEAA